ncbi:MAG: hypothetical protein QGI13_04965 [Rhodospirillales bacterium]|jgi:hypothetical protein|nr:hypothetical protein [Rhodospirillales bacterium]
MTVDDHPLTFIGALRKSTPPPRKIIILEETSFHLFARPDDRIRPGFAANEPPGGRTEDAQSRDYYGYLADKRTVVDREDLRFRDDLRETENLWRKPALLRRFMSETMGRFAHRILPTRVDQGVVLSNFLGGYLRYFIDGTVVHKLWLWKNYRQQFFLPEFGRELRRKWFEFESLKNTSPTANYNCMRYVYPTGPIPSVAEFAEYPAIKGLKRAQSQGSEISIALMPFNPKFEKLCRPKYEPYYKVLFEMAAKSGWTIHDLRGLTVKDIGDFGVFRNHLHLWTNDYDAFHQAIARRLGEAIGEEFVQCGRQTQSVRPLDVGRFVAVAQ